MTDGVLTIPLIADLCFEDFEPIEAASDKPNTSAVTAQNSEARSRTANGAAPTRPAQGICEADFLAGPENRLLFEAVDSLLRESPSPYSPLVLLGPPGTGKSHIARGIARHWRSKDRDVLYTTGADFARSFAAAVENETIAGWRARQRDTSLFVLEDLTQLGRKTSAIDELLYTFDAIQHDRGQIVVTSRLPLNRIAGLPSALVARLSGGLIVSLPVPGPMARRALIDRFAERRGVRLEEGASKVLADALAVTAPELFGAVTELGLESAVDGKPLTPARVRTFLTARRGAVRPALRVIAELSAKYHRVKLSELTSATRRRTVVQARNVAIYLARELAGKSLTHIGEFFGGRDHTTILHGYRTIDARATSDPAVRQALSELRKMLAHG